MRIQSLITVMAIGLTGLFMPTSSIAEEKKLTFKEKVELEKAEKARKRAEADKPFVYTNVQKVSLTKKEIVLYTKAFVAEKFVSAKSVLELSDVELGKVVGDVILPDPEADFLSAFHGIKTRIIIDAKDGKYRLQALNVVATDKDGIPSTWGAVESANRYRIEPMAIRILDGFSEELKTHLTSAKGDNDW